MQRIAIVCCLQYRLTINREPGRKVHRRTGAQGAAPLSTCRLPKRALTQQLPQAHGIHVFGGQKYTRVRREHTGCAPPGRGPALCLMRCCCGLVGRCKAAAASPTPCLGGFGAAHTPGPTAGSDGGGTGRRGHLRGALLPSPADLASGLGTGLGQRCCYKQNRNVKEG